MRAWRGTRRRNRSTHKFSRRAFLRNSALHIPRPSSALQDQAARSALPCRHKTASDTARNTAPPFQPKCTHDNWRHFVRAGKLRPKNERQERRPTCTHILRQPPASPLNFCHALPPPRFHPLLPPDHDQYVPPPPLYPPRLSSLKASLSASLETASLTASPRN